jgi:hypothetical protein
MPETATHSEEEMTTEAPKKLFAVAVEHLPENCPLQQLTPDDANTLANNLKENPSVGVFSMQLHHGIVLVETDSPQELVDLFAQVLPKHKEAEVVEVTHDEHMQAVAANPAVLDTEEGRHALLATAHKHFPEKGFDRTEAEERPSLPLSSQDGKSLPEYLEEHAPKAA